MSGPDFDGDAWVREAFEGASGLDRLTDPVLFELLVHYKERTELLFGIEVCSDPNVTLKEALPEVMEIDEWREQFESAIIEAMAGVMLNGTPEPEALASAALGAFRDQIAKGTAVMMMVHSSALVDPNNELTALHEAVVSLRHTFKTPGVNLQAPPPLNPSGALSEFLAGLDDLIQITQGAPLTSGRRSALIKRAVISAGSYLIGRGLERKTAARVLANLVFVHPDLPGWGMKPNDDIKKLTNNLNQVLRNAGVG